MRLKLPHRDVGAVLADTFQVVGFISTIVGIGLESIPLACIVAGVTLFVVGGLAARRT
jgi:hypothetical protein